MQGNTKVASKVRNQLSVHPNWVPLWMDLETGSVVWDLLNICIHISNHDLTFSDASSAAHTRYRCGRMVIRWWCQRPPPGNWEAVFCLQAAESELHSTGSEPPCPPRRNEPELAGTQRPLPPNCTENECMFHWNWAPSFWWGSEEFSSASCWSGQSCIGWTESLGWGSRHDSPPGSLTPE